MEATKLIHCAVIELMQQLIEKYPRNFGNSFYLQTSRVPGKFDIVKIEFELPGLEALSSSFCFDVHEPALLLNDEHRDSYFRMIIAECIEDLECVPRS